MKVLFCSAEVSPFAKTGGLGDVCGALPLALEKQGIEVAITLPRYKCIKSKKFAIKRLHDDVSTATIGSNTKVYFIENEAFFNRDGLYGDKYGDYIDNLDRFLYFCRRSLGLAKQINFKADIVHCHDWHTALIPVFLKFQHQRDPFYRSMKSILTIHNLAYQGIFPKWDFLQLGLSEDFYSINGLEFYEDINLMKGGIVFSDRVTTVSPGYAKEIQSDGLGCGLDGVIRKRQDPVIGILNGIDYNIWNPKKDNFLAKRYSVDSIQSKVVNKRKLQEKLRLEVKSDVPVFGFVARLSAQKGLDLVASAIDDIMKMDLQMVFQGTGDERYYYILKDMARRYPQKIAIDLEYDEPTAHLIYAGSDFFLMPSVFEPCGLSQMISLRYGTIPLVFKTGGLADTIAHFDSSNGKGNGIVFDKYKKSALVEAIRTATEIYKDKKIFHHLVKKAFTYDFSWEKSAKTYKKLYRQCLSSV